MKCCNSENNNRKLSIQCKGCSQMGIPAKRITLEHLIKEDKLSLIRDVQYFFCSTPTCNVVYFSRNGDVFYKTDLKVRVGIKETEEPILVCYCFGYTKKLIQDDIAQNGYSTIEVKIKKSIKLKECKCEITNPKGVCCLGDVDKIVKEVMVKNKGH